MMITEDALNDIQLAVALGGRLTLIIVFGPGYRVRDGLAELEGALSRDLRVVRHRVDRQGPNVAETVADLDEPRSAVLVSGLERMRPHARRDMLVSMNLLRDTLSARPAIVLLWIPVEFADEFRRHCVDLFHWRSLTVFIEAPADEEQRMRHEYLVALASTELARPDWWRRGRPRETTPITAVSELDLRVGADAPRGVDSWLAEVDRGVLLGAPGSGKTTALRRHAALRASTLLDRHDGELPVLVEAHGTKIDLLDDGDAPHIDGIPSLGPEVVAWLKRQLATASTLLLVDSSTSDPAHAAIRLESWLRTQNNPHLRVVLSLRGGAPPFEVRDWQRAELMPLSAAQITAWLALAAIDDPAGFLRALPTRVTTLAERPLALQALIELFVVEGARSLKLEARTIAAIVHAMFDFHGFPGLTPRRRILYHALALLAARLTPVGSDGFDVDFAEQVARESREPGRTFAADDLRDAENSTGGLLRLETHASGSRLAFSHPAFREYFAGAWLAGSEPELERIAEYAADPAWQRATAHALAQLSSSTLETAFERIWTAANEQPGPRCWAMREVAVEGALSSTERRMWSHAIARAQPAIEQARQAKHPSALWKPVEELISRHDVADA
jgi:hypothetical protein